MWAEPTCRRFSSAHQTMMLIEQVRMCSSARYDLRVELIIVLLPTCSSQRLVDHSAWPVAQQHRLPVRTDSTGGGQHPARSLRRYFFVIYTVDLLTLHIFKNQQNTLIKIHQITKHTSYQGLSHTRKGRIAPEILLFFWGGVSQRNFTSCKGLQNTYSGCLHRHFIRYDTHLFTPTVFPPGGSSRYTWTTIGKRQQNRRNSTKKIQK